MPAVGAGVAVRLRLSVLDRALYLLRWTLGVAVAAVVLWFGSALLSAPAAEAAVVPMAAAQVGLLKGAKPAGSGSGEAKDQKPKDQKPKAEKPKDQKPKDQKPKDQKAKDQKAKDQKPKDQQAKGQKPKDHKVKGQMPKDQKATNQTLKNQTPKVEKAKVEKAKADKAKADKAKVEKAKGQKAGTPASQVKDPKVSPKSTTVTDKKVTGTKAKAAETQAAALGANTEDDDSSSGSRDDSDDGDSEDDSAEQTEKVLDGEIAVANSEKKLAKGETTEAEHQKLEQQADQERDKLSDDRAELVDDVVTGHGELGEQEQTLAAVERKVADGTATKNDLERAKEKYEERRTEVYDDTEQLMQATDRHTDAVDEDDLAEKGATAGCGRDGAFVECGSATEGEDGEKQSDRCMAIAGLSSGCGVSSKSGDAKAEASCDLSGGDGCGSAVEYKAKDGTTVTASARCTGEDCRESAKADEDGAESDCASGAGTCESRSSGSRKRSAADTGKDGTGKKDGTDKADTAHAGSAGSSCAPDCRTSSRVDLDDDSDEVRATAKTDCDGDCTSAEAHAETSAEITGSPDVAGEKAPVRKTSASARCSGKGSCDVEAGSAVDVDTDHDGPVATREFSATSTADVDVECDTDTCDGSGSAETTGSAGGDVDGERDSRGKAECTVHGAGGDCGAESRTEIETRDADEPGDVPGPVSVSTASASVECDSDTACGGTTRSETAARDTAVSPHESGSRSESGCTVHGGRCRADTESAASSAPDFASTDPATRLPLAGNAPQGPSSMSSASASIRCDPGTPCSGTAHTSTAAWANGEAPKTAQGTVGCEQGTAGCRARTVAHAVTGPGAALAFAQNAEQPVNLARLPAGPSAAAASGAVLTCEAGRTACDGKAFSAASAVDPSVSPDPRGSHSEGTCAGVTNGVCQAVTNSGASSGPDANVIAPLVQARSTVNATVESESTGEQQQAPAEQPEQQQPATPVAPGSSANSGAPTVPGASSWTMVEATLDCAGGGPCAGTATTTASGTDRTGGLTGAGAARGPPDTSSNSVSCTATQSRCQGHATSVAGSGQVVADMLAEQQHQTTDAPAALSQSSATARCVGTGCSAATSGTAGGSHTGAQCTAAANGCAVASEATAARVANAGVDDRKRPVPGFSTTGQTTSQVLCPEAGCTGQVTGAVDVHAGTSHSTGNGVARCAGATPCQAQISATSSTTVATPGNAEERFATTSATVAAQCADGSAAGCATETSSTSDATGGPGVSGRSSATCAAAGVCQTVTAGFTTAHLIELSAGCAGTGCRTSTDAAAAAGVHHGVSRTTCVAGLHGSCTGVSRVTATADGVQVAAACQGSAGTHCSHTFRASSTARSATGGSVASANARCGASGGAGSGWCGTNAVARTGAGFAMAAAGCQGSPGSGCRHSYSAHSSASAAGARATATGSGGGGVGGGMVAVSASAESGPGWATASASCTGSAGVRCSHAYSASVSAYDEHASGSWAQAHASGSGGGGVGSGGVAVSAYAEAGDGFANAGASCTGAANCAADFTAHAYAEDELVTPYGTYTAEKWATCSGSGNGGCGAWAVAIAGPDGMGVADSGCSGDGGCAQGGAGLGFQPAKIDTSGLGITVDENGDPIPIEDVDPDHAAVEVTELPGGKVEIKIKPAGSDTPTTYTCTAPCSETLDGITGGNDQGQNNPHGDYYGEMPVAGRENEKHTVRGTEGVGMAQDARGNAEAWVRGRGIVRDGRTGDEVVFTRKQAAAGHPENNVRFANVAGSPFTSTCNGGCVWTAPTGEKLVVDGAFGNIQAQDAGGAPARINFGGAGTFTNAQGDTVVSHGTDGNGLTNIIGRGRNGSPGVYTMTGTTGHIQFADPNYSAANNPHFGTDQHGVYKIELTGGDLSHGIKATTPDGEGKGGSLWCRGDCTRTLPGSYNDQPNGRPVYDPVTACTNCRIEEVLPGATGRFPNGYGSVELFDGSNGTISRMTPWGDKQSCVAGTSCSFTQFNRSLADAEGNGAGKGGGAICNAAGEGGACSGFNAYGDFQSAAVVDGTPVRTGLTYRSNADDPYAARFCVGGSGACTGSGGVEIDAPKATNDAMLAVLDPSIKVSEQTAKDLAALQGPDGTSLLGREANDLRPLTRTEYEALEATGQTELLDRYRKDIGEHSAGERDTVQMAILDHTVRERNLQPRYDELAPEIDQLTTLTENALADDHIDGAEWAKISPLHEKIDKEAPGLLEEWMPLQQEKEMMRAASWTLADFKAANQQVGLDRDLAEHLLGDAYDPSAPPTDAQQDTIIEIVAGQQQDLGTAQLALHSAVGERNQNLADRILRFNNLYERVTADGGRPNPAEAMWLLSERDAIIAEQDEIADLSRPHLRTIDDRQRVLRQTDLAYADASGNQAWADQLRGAFTRHDRINVLYHRLQVSGQWRQRDLSQTFGTLDSLTELRYNYVRDLPFEAPNNFGGVGPLSPEQSLMGGRYLPSTMMPDFRSIHTAAKFFDDWQEMKGVPNADLQDYIRDQHDLDAQAGFAASALGPQTISNMFRGQEIENTPEAFREMGFADEDITTIRDRIDELSRDGKVTVVSMPYWYPGSDEEEAGWGTVPLFVVTQDDGSLRLIDQTGAHFSGLEDFVNNNEILAEDGKLLAPENLGDLTSVDEDGLLANGRQPDNCNCDVVTNPGRHRSTWDKIGGYVVGGLMVVGGILLIAGGGIATLASLGTASPLGAAAAIAGAALITGGIAYTTYDAVSNIVNRSNHGQSNSWSNPAARADYLGLVGNALAVTGLGIGLKAAVGGATSALAAGGGAGVRGASTGLWSKLVTGAPGWQGAWRGGMLASATTWRGMIPAGMPVLGRFAQPASTAARWSWGLNQAAFGTFAWTAGEGTVSYFENRGRMTDAQQSEAMGGLIMSWGMVFAPIAFGIGAKLPGVRSHQAIGLPRVDPRTGNPRGPPPGGNPAVEPGTAPVTPDPGTLPPARPQGQNAEGGPAVRQTPRQYARDHGVSRAEARTALAGQANARVAAWVNEKLADPTSVTTSAERLADYLGISRAQAWDAVQHVRTRHLAAHVEAAMARGESPAAAALATQFGVPERLATATIRRIGTQRLRERLTALIEQGVRPTEESLAAEFGVPRSTAKAALRIADDPDLSLRVLDIARRIAETGRRPSVEELRAQLGLTHPVEAAFVLKVAENLALARRTALINNPEPALPSTVAGIQAEFGVTRRVAAAALEAVTQARMLDKAVALAAATQRPSTEELAAELGISHAEATGVLDMAARLEADAAGQRQSAATVAATLRYTRASAAALQRFDAAIAAALQRQASAYAAAEAVLGAATPDERAAAEQHHAAAVAAADRQYDADTAAAVNAYLTEDNAAVAAHTTEVAAARQAEQRAQERVLNSQNEETPPAEGPATPPDTPVVPPTPAGRTGGSAKEGGGDPAGSGNPGGAGTGPKPKKPGETTEGTPDTSPAGPTGSKHDKTTTGLDPPGSGHISTALAAFRVHVRTWTDQIRTWSAELPYRGLVRQIQEQQQRLRDAVQDDGSPQAGAAQRRQELEQRADLAERAAKDGRRAHRDVLVDSFALTAESIRRQFGHQMTREQFIADLALTRGTGRLALYRKMLPPSLRIGLTVPVRARGTVVELPPSAGKTYTGMLVAGWNSLYAKRGTHVVVPNDYLAWRDHQLYTAVFERQGVGVGHIYARHPRPAPDAPDAQAIAEGTAHGVQPRAEKQDAYDQPITVGPVSEFAHDEARTAIAPAAERLDIQRDRMVVDEADQILVDFARTPYIVAAPSGAPAGLAEHRARGIVSQLRFGRHYAIGKGGVRLTGHGESLIGLLAPDLRGDVINALAVDHFYRENVDYFVADGHVVLVDLFSGRAQHGHRLRDGMHEALEAKHRVPVRPRQDTLAQITLMALLARYRSVSGLTGTTAGARTAFARIYGLSTVRVRVPGPGPAREAALVYATEALKLDAAALEAANRAGEGRPVVTVSGTIRDTEAMAGRTHGVQGDLLNPRPENANREVVIVGHGGRPGAVTHANMMAGRGTNFLLGGDPAFGPAARQEVVDAGGLHLIRTERFGARRINDQADLRAGRRGDPGSTREYLALTDELLARHADRKKLAALQARYDGHAGPIHDRAVLRLFDRAVRAAEKQAYRALVRVAGDPGSADRVAAAPAAGTVDATVQAQLTALTERAKAASADVTAARRAILDAEKTGSAPALPAPNPAVPRCGGFCTAAQELHEVLVAHGAFVDAAVTAPGVPRVPGVLLLGYAAGAAERGVTAGAARQAADLAGNGELAGAVRILDALSAVAGTLADEHGRIWPGAVFAESAARRALGLAQRMRAIEAVNPLREQDVSAEFERRALLAALATLDGLLAHLPANALVADLGERPAPGVDEWRGHELLVAGVPAGHTVRWADRGGFAVTRADGTAVVIPAAQVRHARRQLALLAADPDRAAQAGAATAAWWGAMPADAEGRSAVAGALDALAAFPDREAAVAVAVEIVAANGGVPAVPVDELTAAAAAFFESIVAAGVRQREALLTPLEGTHLLNLIRDWTDAPSREDRDALEDRAAQLQGVLADVEDGLTELARTKQEQGDALEAAVADAKTALLTELTHRDHGAAERVRKMRAGIELTQTNRDAAYRVSHGYIGARARAQTAAVAVTRLRHALRRPPPTIADTAELGSLAQDVATALAAYRKAYAEALPPRDSFAAWSPTGELPRMAELVETVNRLLEPHGGHRVTEEDLHVKLMAEPGRAAGDGLVVTVGGRRSRWRPWYDPGTVEIRIRLRTGAMTEVAHPTDVVGREAVETIFGTLTQGGAATGSSTGRSAKVNVGGSTSAFVDALPPGLIRTVLEFVELRLGGNTGRAETTSGGTSGFALGGGVSDNRGGSILVEMVTAYDVSVRTATDPGRSGWDWSASVRVGGDRPTTTTSGLRGGGDVMRTWVSHAYQARGPPRTVRLSAEHRGTTPFPWHATLGVTGLEPLADATVAALAPSGLVGGITRDQVRALLVEELQGRLDTAVNTQLTRVVSDVAGRPLANLRVTATPKRWRLVGVASVKEHLEDLRVAFSQWSTAQSSTRSWGGELGAALGRAVRTLLAWLPERWQLMIATRLGISGNQSVGSFTSSNAIRPGVPRFSGHTQGARVELTVQVEIEWIDRGLDVVAPVRGDAAALIRAAESDIFRHGGPIDAGAVVGGFARHPAPDTRLRDDPVLEAPAGRTAALPESFASGRLRGIGHALVRNTTGVGAVHDDVLAALRAEGLIPPADPAQWSTDPNELASQLANLREIDEHVSAVRLEASYDQLLQNGLLVELYRNRNWRSSERVYVRLRLRPVRDEGTILHTYDGHTAAWTVVGLDIGSNTSGRSTSQGRGQSGGLTGSGTGAIGADTDAAEDGPQTGNSATVEAGLNGSLGRSAGQSNGRTGNGVTLVESTATLAVFTVQHTLDVDLIESGAARDLTSGPVGLQLMFPADLLPDRRPIAGGMNTTPTEVLELMTQYALDAGDVFGTVATAIAARLGPGWRLDPAAYQQLHEFTSVESLRSQLLELLGPGRRTRLLVRGPADQRAWVEVLLHGRAGASRHITVADLVVGVIRLTLGSLGVESGTSRGGGWSGKFQWSFNQTGAPKGDTSVNGSRSGNRSATGAFMRIWGREPMAIETGREYVNEMDLEIDVSVRKVGSAGSSAPVTVAGTMQYVLPERHVLDLYIRGVQQLPPELVADAVQRLTTGTLKLDTATTWVLLSRYQQGVAAEVAATGIAPAYADGHTPEALRTAYDLAKNRETFNGRFLGVGPVDLAPHLRTGMAESTVEQVRLHRSAPSGPDRPRAYLFDAVLDAVEQAAPGALERDPVLWNWLFNLFAGNRWLGHIDAMLAGAGFDLQVPVRVGWLPGADRVTYVNVRVKATFDQDPERVGRTDDVFMILQDYGYIETRTSRGAGLAHGLGGSGAVGPFAGFGPSAGLGVDRSRGTAADSGVQQTTLRGVASADGADRIRQGITLAVTAWAGSVRFTRTRAWFAERRGQRAPPVTAAVRLLDGSITRLVPDGLAAPRHRGHVPTAPERRVGLGREFTLPTEARVDVRSERLADEAARLLAGWGLLGRAGVERNRERLNQAMSPVALSAFLHWAQKPGGMQLAAFSVPGLSGSFVELNLHARTHLDDVTIKERKAAKGQPEIRTVHRRQIIGRTGSSVSFVTPVAVNGGLAHSSSPVNGGFALFDQGAHHHGAITGNRDERSKYEKGKQSVVEARIVWELTARRVRMTSGVVTRIVRNRRRSVTDGSAFITLFAHDLPQIAGPDWRFTLIRDTDLQPLPVPRGWKQPSVWGTGPAIRPGGGGYGGISGGGGS